MSAVTVARAGQREWVGLAVIAIPCLLYSMDLTVLNLAVPRLSADLKPSSAQLLWIVDIYGFLIAGLLITMGTLGDRIGRRRLLLIGAAGFGVASLLAAFATTAEMLILARALLGVAAATLAPSTLSLIRNMFLDPKQRTFAIGIWVASFSAGGAIGPLLGGIFLEYFWWGSVFLLNVPIMILLLVAGPLLLPEFRDPKAGRIDLISAMQSLIAVLAVIFGMKRFSENGTILVPALSIAIGLAMGLIFVRRQQRLADPLIDLRLFRSRPFSVAVAVNVLGCFAAFGAFLFVAQYLQLVLGMGPLEAGLWTAPTGLAFIAGSLLAPALGERFGPTKVMAGGFAVAGVGFILLTQIGGAHELAIVVTGFIILALGLAPVVTMTTDVIVSSAPPERAGVASAISETGAELGGALGIAVLGSIVTVVYRGAMASVSPAGLPAAVAEAARDTLGGATAVAEQLSGPIGAALLETARQAFTQGVIAAATISAVIGVGAALATALILRDAGKRPVE